MTAEPRRWLTRLRAWFVGTHVNFHTEGKER